MAQGKERFEWRYRLEKNLEQQQACWDRLKESAEKLMNCMQERDRMMLKLLEQTEQERRQEQETGMEEKLEQLSAGICRIGESMKNGFADLEKQTRSGQALDDELAKYRDEIGHLQSENGRLKDALSQAEKEKDGEDPEVERAKALYECYKAWPGKADLSLHRLSDENVLKFYKSCSDEERIGYLFRSLGRGSFVWEEKDPQGLRLLNDIIDFCIDLQKQNGKQLRRQKVQEQEKFSSSYHLKNETESAVGYIKKVFLQGVEDHEGMIYDQCRAFVEIDAR